MMELDSAVGIIKAPELQSSEYSQQMTQTERDAATRLRARRQELEAIRAQVKNLCKVCF